jgi:hypothetical protein
VLKEAYSLDTLPLAPLVWPQSETDLRAVVLSECEPGGSDELAGSEIGYGEHIDATRFLLR